MLREYLPGRVWSACWCGAGAAAGSERASAWTSAPAGTTPGIGSVGAEGARSLLLEGAADPLVLPID